MYGDSPYGSNEVKVSFEVMFIVKGKAAVCGTPRTTNVPLTPGLPIADHFRVLVCRASLEMFFMIQVSCTNEKWRA